LFEEANGADQLLFDLDLGQTLAPGFDLSADTVAQAGQRAAGASRPFFVSDARKLALRSNSVDLIISTSTLDHMDGAADLENALRELYRVLRPGGRMALTLDNPWNPVYPILRVICAMPGAPFELGYTTTRAGLDGVLRKVGFTAKSWRPIVHNPRLASTAYFMALRKIFGHRADGVIAKSLDLFDRFEKLPTRWISCCFMAVCVEKAARSQAATARSETYRMVQAG
jgi:SAM-dependent methyltransferase